MVFADTWNACWEMLMPTKPDTDTAELQAAIAEFLQQFDTALAVLPAPERDAIVRETRQHLDERAAQEGVAAAWAALRAFGPAEIYAAQFTDERIGQGVPMQPTNSSRTSNSFPETLAICATIVVVLALLTAGAFLFRG